MMRKPVEKPDNNLLRPSLSRGNSKECEEGPADIVVVKLVSLPLSPLHLLFVSAVVDVETSAGVRKLVVTLLNNLTEFLLLQTC